MATITLYLNFNGNCREAMTFYRNCLGGKLTFQTIGEGKEVGRMSPRMKNSILHAELRNEQLILMGSDMIGEEGLLKGNNISLMLTCSSIKEITSFYRQLSEGGMQTHPLKENFWNAIFGVLKDRYGITWILSYQKKHKTGVKTPQT